MRNVILRIAVGVTGIVLLVIALGAWHDPASTGGKLGLAGVGGLGLATLRADLGAFFATAGGLALAAAIRRSPVLLTAPLAMMVLALAGRCLALLLTPFENAMIPPMIAEAVMVAIFAAGRFMRTAP
jgi:hypothetical protein